jgi:hypothetical protein
MAIDDSARAAPQERFTCRLIAAQATGPLSRKRPNSARQLLKLPEQRRHAAQQHII